MELSKLIVLNHIKVPLIAADKTGVITELVDVLSAAGNLSQRDVVLDAVLRREAERTTGIGYGLAIPHGKSTGCKSLSMAAGKTAVPIDFQSLDRRPVNFVVLLISPPDQTSAHIQALAKISRLMNIGEFRAAVERAANAQDLHAAIQTYESMESGRI